MSDIMIGVLSMPDELFWSDEPLARAQHNHVRLEAAKKLTESQALIDDLCGCVDHLVHNAKTSGAEMGLAIDFAEECLTNAREVFCGN